MAHRTAMAGLVVAACGLVASCTPGGPVSQTVSQLFPTFGLYFNQDDQAASLAYGEANSDDVGLMLRCDRGSRQVNLTDVALARPADRLVLTSGPQRMDLPVKLSTDETGASLAEASLPADSPVLQDFRRSGVIAVSLGGSRYGLKAKREEQPAVSQFFAACERS